MGNTMVANFSPRLVNDFSLIESDLVTLAQQGNLEAFNQLVMFHQDKIYGLAMRMLGDQASAEDITQNTFLSAFRSLPGFRNGSFRSWLYRIATNACYDELRRRKSHPLQTLEAEEDEGEEFLPGYDFSQVSPSPEKEYERKESEQFAQQMLSRLSADYRAVVVLVDLQEMEYLEAARILNVPVGTVKSRLARARLQLQRFFIKDGKSKEDRKGGALVAPHA
jgi:RNA polymerase sigma-70 factor (ECF subfamily)